MDDLVFKNIPAEGFDPQSGCSDRRLSTPSVRAENNDTNFSDYGSRLSNPTPSRKSNSDIGADEQAPVADAPVITDPFSRVSNPTPTRRGTSETSHFGSVLQDFSSSSISDMESEAFARASNPTPTRRKVSAENTNVPDGGVVPGSDVSRASNPTPTRRGGTTSVLPVDESEFDKRSSLSFASVTDPYGVGRTEDSRVSNPTPTRRLFVFDSAPTDDEYDDSSRLSNISPSSRK